MFCKHCGIKMDDDSNFCPKCGTPAQKINTENEQTAANSKENLDDLISRWHYQCLFENYFDKKDEIISIISFIIKESYSKHELYCLFAMKDYRKRSIFFYRIQEGEMLQTENLKAIKELKDLFGNGRSFSSHFAESDMDLKRAAESIYNKYGDEIAYILDDDDDDEDDDYDDGVDDVAEINLTEEQLMSALEKAYSDAHKDTEKEDRVGLCKEFAEYLHQISEFQVKALNASLDMLKEGIRFTVNNGRMNYSNIKDTAETIDDIFTAASDTYEGIRSFSAHFAEYTENSDDTHRLVNNEISGISDNLNRMKRTAKELLDALQDSHINATKVTDTFSYYIERYRFCTEANTALSDYFSRIFNAYICDGRCPSQLRSDALNDTKIIIALHYIKNL